MTDQKDNLARAKRTYDASGVPTCRLVGTLVALPTVVADDEPGPDVDLVRRAREDLWRRLPACFRRKPSEIASWFDPKARAILDAAMAWDWGSPSLLICAPTDWAKSAAAALVAIRLMARGRESEHERWRGIHWQGVPELMGAARQWPLGAGECPEVRRVSRCKLAILDDLGNEHDHGSTLFEVTQARYQRELPNIVTTGLSPRQLVDRYGECILRRLVQRHGQMGTIIDLTGAP